jgi:hypothetical protein
MEKYRLWDGLTKSEIFDDDDDAEYVNARIALFENAKSSQWNKVLDFLFNDSDELPPNSELVYSVELDNANLNTLLHYAALTNANIDVIQRLVQEGSPRTRRNSDGKRPIDIARENGYERLYSVLEPEIKYPDPVAFEELQQIEHHFHNVIVERARFQVESYSLQLPQLEMLLELDTALAFFLIPGMMGGFEYCLRWRDFRPVLFSFNAPRMGWGPQMHKITVSGSELVAEDDGVGLAFLIEERNYP